MSRILGLPGTGSPGALTSEITVKLPGDGGFRELLYDILLVDIDYITYLHYHYVSHIEKFFQLWPIGATHSGSIFSLACL